MQEIIEIVQPSITEEANQKMMKPFTMEEFRQALFQMHSTKAPEPDGLNPTFFKLFGTYVNLRFFIQASCGLTLVSFRLVLSKPI